MNVAGSYRQLQTRLRANAESVAAYGGIEKEGNLINDSFKKVVRHRSKLLQTQWLFGMWQVAHRAGFDRLSRSHKSFYREYLGHSRLGQGQTM